MCNYMVLESWLNEQADPENRGKVFSMYMITSYLGMVGGQYALSQFPELGLAPLLLVCIAVSFGIVPIATTRRIHPKPLKLISVSFISYFKAVPQSLTAVLFAGIINGSFYGLAPVYAKEIGFDTNDIALFMSLTIVAGLLAQWPMGVLSDKLKRSVLIRINTVLIGAISLFMTINAIAHPIMLVATFAFGLFAFTLYPLSSALANSRLSDEDRVGVSSALLVAFGVGAGFGSSIIAQLMEMIGHQALYGAISILTVVMFSLLTAINSIQKREKPKHSDYVVTPSDITASPLAATFDPRIEESTVMEQFLVSEEQVFDSTNKTTQ